MTMDDSTTKEQDEEERPRVTDKRGVSKMTDADLDAVKMAQNVAQEREAQQLREFLLEHGERPDVIDGMALQGLRDEVLRVQSAATDAPGVPEDDGTSQPPADAKSVLTAFLVVVDHNGYAIADANLHQALVVDREATLHDMWVGAATVIRDIDQNATAQRMLSMMNTQAQAMAQQAMAQRAMIDPGHKPRSR